MSDKHVKGYSDGKTVGKIILGVMLCFSLVVPYVVRTYLDILVGPVIQISAVLWTFRSDTLPPIRVGIGDLMTGLIIILPRLWFTYEVYRYSQTMASRARAITAGIISELVLVVPRIISYITDPESYFGLYYQYVIPLPSLMVAGFLIIFLLPKSRHDSDVFHDSFIADTG